MIPVEKVLRKPRPSGPTKLVLILLALLTAFAGRLEAQSLPPGWSAADIGSVGQAGTSSYTDGAFTIAGAGQGIAGTADGMHFVYQSLSGDGTIIARVTSAQGSTYPEAGVMIRETLATNSRQAYVAYRPYTSPSIYFKYRLSAGGGTSALSATVSGLPYWVKLVRSGNTFTAYRSSDGVSWFQVGTAQTISMGQSTYVGLAVSSTSDPTLATALVDGVSINSAAQSAPVVTSVSPTTGLPGTQVVISGSGFSASQGNSVVRLNGTSLTVSSWSDTSISITIPQGATTGSLQVSVASSMNNSAPALFTVLPSGWLEQDIGAVGASGSGTYANGTFTVKGVGQLWGSSDKLHFVYQQLSGDGAVVARVSTIQGATSPQVGVMIRETLSPDARSAVVFFQPNTASLYYRTTPGASTLSTTTGFSAPSSPYWVRIMRDGNTFSAYISLDGATWTQVGTSQTITMGENVYAGLVVSGTATNVATVAFEHASVTSVVSPAPIISGLSATTGSIGSQVVITGLWFGTTQGSSVVLLNGAPLTVNSWSETSITATIPAGATTGRLAVFTAPSMNSSNTFVFTVTTQPLPSGWLNQDVGAPTTAGSATYASGTFTVQGTGQISSTSDKFHFAYRPLAGDGSIIARVSSFSGGTTKYVGVMIRESLDVGARSTFVWFQPNTAYLYSRATPGANTTSTSTFFSASAYPYWVRMTRSGNVFTAYISLDAVNWTQVGTSQTIAMAQNTYVGLAVAGTGTGLVTAAFDHVSVGSPASPAPVITGVSATTGSIGGQVVITGQWFGASQGSSVLLLNGALVTINSWNDGSITFTIPTGATSGRLAVFVAPTMNSSNPITFYVTSQPLPSGWLNQDVGVVSVAGSGTYAGGTFTVQGSGLVSSTSDKFHFVYQPFLGDGAIVARVSSISGSSSPQVGVMIRETLNPDARSVLAYFYPNTAYLGYRATTGGSTATATTSFSSASSPYWVRVVRNGNSFSGYISSDGQSWTQTGTSQTIAMASSTYAGLVVSTGNPTTATFDNVSFTIGTTPLVTGLSPNSGGTDTSVTITGANFGATQGTSTVSFNGGLASVTSWSDAQIVATVPAAAPRGSGLVTVTVNSVPSLSNVSFTVYRPVINSATPPTSPIAGLVTVAGEGFGTYQGLSRVKFNGVEASIKTWSDTTVEAWVPSGATTGPLTATVGGVVSNGVSFTVGALTVTGVSPSSGPRGGTVTITGSGFGASQSSSTLMFYGNTATTITSWSDTEIEAVVPPAAATGEVSVKVAGITAVGPVFTLTATAQLTDSHSNTSTYNAVMLAGQWLVTDATGSGCSTCTQRGVVHHSYSTNGNILSTTDELGRTTSYTYDSNGNVTSVSRPIGAQTATTSYTYNSFGQVLTVTDPLGNVTTNTYDANGNLTSVTTPAPDGSTAASVTQFAYDSLGQLTQITDPLNRVTTIAYNSVGLISTITDAQNNVTSYGYDARGNRTSVTDALGKTTTFTYDAGNRLTQITAPSPDGTAPQPVTTFAYDYRGRRTSVTDANSKVTTYAYDDADRLTSVTDAASNVTTYAYDTENNLTSITDASSRTTYFEYDAFGRVTEVNFPSTLSETYAYDAVGNLTSKTDRKNQTINYVYDGLDRLTSKTYPDSSQVEYVYDLVGKIQSVNDPTGTYSFAYDNMGRLVGTTTSYSFLTSRNFTVGYTYDKNSNRTGMTDPESGVTAYAYDTLNRLTTLTPPAAFTTGSFGFSYDALSRRTQMTRPNNVSTDYTYDNLSRLLNVLHKLSGSTIDGASYTVDAVGNRTAKANLLPSAPVENYTYDAIYQLTQAVQNGSTTAESYTYDPVGNRLSSLAASPWNYNVSNQLTSISGSPGTTFTYDSNGNTTSKTDATGTTTYTWDYENRLTSVTLPNSGGTVSFTYDPLGRRIRKVFGSATTIYAYDGENIVEETDGSGTAVARYAMGLSIDEPLAMLRSSATHFYSADGLGSITSLTDASGAVAASYSYDTFGNLTASAGSLVNPFRYTAREWDTETGLYFYRARYYDSMAGRFLSEDPLGTDSDDLDLYRYVQNSPVGYTDPRGLAKTHDCGGGCKFRVERDPHKGVHVNWWCKGGLQGCLLIPSLRPCEVGKSHIHPRRVEDCIRRKLNITDAVQRNCDKTAEEYKTEEQSYRYMEEFWKTILIGDVILGVVGTAGALGWLGGGAAAGGAALPKPIPLPRPAPAPVPLRPAA